MKIRLLTPVQHDASVYAAGDTADLPADAAKALMDCGAAELVVDKPTGKADANKPGAG